MLKVLIIFTILSFTLHAQLQENFNDFVRHQNNASASISFEVFDLDSNRVLFHHDKQKRLVTASTMKLWSTAYALESLGADYRPQTKIFMDGTLDSTGTLHGNLIIQGGGDPSLGSRYFGTEENVDFVQEWVSAIKAKGISRIDGKVHMDGSAIPYNNMVDGWTWGDVGNYYGTQASGLVLCDNTQFLHFKTSSVGSPSRLTSNFPPTPEFHFDNQILAGNHRSDRSMIYGAPFSSFRLGTGSLPANRSDFVVKGSLPDPEESFGKLVYEALKQSGIESEGYTTQRKQPFTYLANQPVHVHLGPSIQSIVNLTNEKSINIFAEQLVALTWLEGNKSEASIYEKYQAFWSARFPNLRAQMHDGSGLARTNAVSAEDFCQLLQYINQQNCGVQFKTSLPTAGKNGTVKALCQGGPGQGKIRCKSGTMKGVKSFAGYATSKSGRHLAFAIIINQHDFESNASITREISKVLNAMILNY